MSELPPDEKEKAFLRRQIEYFDQQKQLTEERLAELEGEPLDVEKFEAAICLWQNGDSSLMDECFQDPYFWEYLGRPAKRTQGG